MDAPTFERAYPFIQSAIGDRAVLTYNLAFDLGRVNYGCELIAQPSLLSYSRDHCLMEWYSQWYGDWHDYYKSYRFQSLCGSHRALGDCETALERLKEMASDSAAFSFPASMREEAQQLGVDLDDYLQ